MNPPVSVLVPAYNGARFLGDTLHSILAQTYPPAEVIVVDDGSTDGTREIVAGFGERVRYHYRENGGICKARNTAASLASSAYLAFCDHDDLWRPDKLERQMALHGENPELPYSFTDFALVSGDSWDAKTKLDGAPADFFAEPVPAGSACVYGHSLYEALLRYQPVWPSTVVIGRKYFWRLGGFLEELGKNPSEDFEFTLRCVQKGPIGIVREPVVGVRRHGGNFSASNERNTYGQIAILRYVLEHHPLSERTRELVLEQIEVRQVEVSSGAFRRSEFGEVVNLLSGVRPAYMDSKTRLKYGIAKMPGPVARVLQKLMVKKEA